MRSRILASVVVVALVLVGLAIGQLVAAAPVDPAAPVNNAPVGRYQIAATDKEVFVIDTSTGALWRNDFATRSQAVWNLINTADKLHK